MVRNIVMIFILFFLMMSSIVRAATYTITVSSQNDFDNLNEKMLSLLGNAGEINIHVVFSQGIYSFHENHFNFKNINSQGAALCFEGNNSVLIAEGRDYGNGDGFSDEVTPTESFVTTDGKDLNTWSKMLRTSNHLVEVLDKTNGLCRLNVSDLSCLTDKNEEECRWMYIWIPQWYASIVYRVTKIQEGFIYFTISPSDMINGDSSYGKISQLRFRLSNNPDVRGDVLISDGRIYLPEGVGKVRHAKVARLMNSYNNKFKSISIRDLKIYGNGKENNNIEAPNMNNQLIDLRYTKSDSISISHCEFKSLQVAAINVTSTNNVFIRNCDFEDCYSYCIYQDRSSRGLDIHDCIFNNVNKRITFSKAIFCSGTDFHVYNNVISNFGYCAIAAGIWLRNPDITMNCNGVIERNEIFYTQPYFEKADDYNLMDSGAVYLYTVTNSTIVRYNHIHHYGGALDNRGIFCDDGARNFQIYGNTITNIANSYSIDSRRVTVNISGLGEVNVNNIIRDNIVDRPIRFQGNEMRNNGCIYEGNIHLDGNYSDDKISNVN